MTTTTTTAPATTAPTATTTSTTTTSTTTTTSIPREPTAASADPEICRLADSRPPNGVPYSVGFPLDGNTPAKGNIRVALIPIDFSDSVGTSDELDNAASQIEKFNEWIAFSSRSSLTVEWSYHRAWLRALQPSTEYNLGAEAVYGAMGGGDSRPYKATVQAFGTEMIALADPFIDFTDNQFVFFLLPKSIVHIDPHVGFFHLEVPSDEGTLAKMWGGGAFFNRPDTYGDPKELWGVWVHEIGHTFGLAGHAPVAILGREDEPQSTDSDLHLMGTQDALHKVFSAWDQWLLGWLPEEDVYCLPAEQLGRSDLELIALERGGTGYRTAIIPLSATSALVVESHRGEGFAERALPYGNGIVVYLVDTTIDYDRSGESQGKALERFAVYIAPTTTDSSKMSRARVDPFLSVGESITHDGVTVQFIYDGPNDVIRITR